MVLSSRANSNPDSNSNSSLAEVRARVKARVSLPGCLSLVGRIEDLRTKGKRQLMLKLLEQ